MLRLTAPGEGTEDTRRRATITELVSSPGEAEAIETVVRAMADARLLTAGADEQSGERLVDVSHEALIRSWPRLRKWIDEDRASLRLLRRVTEAAQEWQRLNRDEGVLYRGARLFIIANQRVYIRGQELALQVAEIQQKLPQIVFVPRLYQVISEPAPRIGIRQFWQRIPGFHQSQVSAAVSVRTP